MHRGRMVCLGDGDTRLKYIEGRDIHGLGCHEGHTECSSNFGKVT